MAVNPYALDLSGLQQGMQVGQQLRGLQDVRGQRRAAQQEQERQQAFNLGLQQLDFQDRQAVAEFSQMFPDYQDTLIAQRDFFNEQHRSDVGNAAVDNYQAMMIGDDDLVRQTLEQTSPIIRTLDQQEDADTLFELYKNDPEQYQAILAGAMVSTGKGDFLKTVNPELHDPTLKTQKELEWAKIDGKQREIDIKELDQKLRQEENLVERERLQLQREEKERLQFQYGDLSPEKAIGVYNDVKRFRTTDNMLNVMLESAYQLEAEGAEELKASRVGQWLRGFIGNDWITDEQRNKMKQKLDAGSIDIALELSEALKPVSQEQFQKLIDSLRGGTVSEAIQNIKSTKRRVRENYNNSRDTLDAANARGLLSRVENLQDAPEQLGRPQQDTIDQPAPGELPPGIPLGTPRQPPSGIYANPRAVEAIRNNPQRAGAFVQRFGYYPENM